ncbi:phage tail protein [Flavisolibacter nicotianae]|uniref:phage tail protein n=1 Tax=Flavisolibacter nicotianae TaxID=2364882 RepID=UPI000EADB0B6|nr:tail fiber protein [Flavisolibacter nicotianae]
MPESPLLGEITISGINFAPRGYAFCQGQILSIAQNTALFALLGTTYGGNGQTTFALPDLRGRVPMGQGQGPGLSPRTLGELSGTETVTLLSTQMPIHNHAFTAVSDAGDTSSPSGAYLANTGALDREYKTSGTAVQMNPAAVGTAGGSQPHNNMPPYLVLNFYIALEGIFPSRN